MLHDAWQQFSIREGGFIIKTFFRVIPIFTFLFLANNIAMGQEKELIPGDIQYDSIGPGPWKFYGNQIQGLKKTKPYIILREIPWKTGDSLSIEKLNQELPWVRNRIFNTGLFLSVSLEITRHEDSTLVLVVKVKERFYTYPIPILELADRNFNEWWFQRGRDLNRLDVGLYLKQKNVRGRNETFKLKFTLGFNKKLEIQYQFPYLNKKLKTGLVLFSGIILNRQAAASTQDNQLVFLETSGILRTRFNGGFYFTRRNSFYTAHQLGMQYQYIRIQDTLASVNPLYLLDSSNEQHGLSLRYQWLFDRRDFAKYPLKGHYCLMEPEGIRFENQKRVYWIAQARLEAAHYKPLGKRWNWANTLRIKWSSSPTQAYFNQRGFGYKEDFVSGYQLYVIDGTQFFLTKSHLRWKLFASNFENPFMPLAKFKQTPFLIMLKVLLESGYVHQPILYGSENNLGNTWLYGYGVGIDISSYYDAVARIEISRNHLHETGIYLHLKAAF
ncbi:MAG: hypothetical protein MUF42_10405 [Cytophagaceae bacterium]|jgi:hypothetical protein|nr:hypothetical protein [Cytophagaceae bacterium]